MRKYLLLATTAMLFAGNAMAGSIATDGQSATIGVSAKMDSADSIYEATDMEFGEFVVLDNKNGDFLRLGTDGTITKLEDGIVKFSSAGTAATLKVDGSTRTGIAIECAWNGNDISASSSERCALASEDSSGLYITKVTMVETGTIGSTAKGYALGATLGAEGSGGTETQNAAPVIRVTLQY